MFQTAIIIICVIAVVGATAYGIWMEHCPQKESEIDNVKKKEKVR